MKFFFLGAMLVIVSGFPMESKEMCSERNVFAHKSNVSLNRKVSSETPIKSEEFLPSVNDSSKEKEQECSINRNGERTEQPPYSFYEFGNEYYYPQTANNENTRCYTHIEDGTVFYRCD